MNRFLKITILVVLALGCFGTVNAQNPLKSNGSGNEMKALGTALENANTKATQFFVNFFGADTLTTDQIIDSIAAELAGPIRGAARATFVEFEAHTKKQATKSPEKTKPFTVKVPKVKGELASLLRTTIEKDFPTAVTNAKQNFAQCRKRNGDAEACKEEIISAMSNAILANVKQALKAWFEKKLSRL